MLSAINVNKLPVFISLIMIIITLSSCAFEPPLSDLRPSIAPIRVGVNTDGEVVSAIEGSLTVPIEVFDIANTSSLYALEQYREKTKNRVLAVRVNGDISLFKLPRWKEFKLRYVQDEMPYELARLEYLPSGDIFLGLRSIGSELTLGDLILTDYELPEGCSLLAVDREGLCEMPGSPLITNDPESLRCLLEYALIEYYIWKANEGLLRPEDGVFDEDLLVSTNTGLFVGYTVEDSYMVEGAIVTGFEFDSEETAQTVADYLNKGMKSDPYSRTRYFTQNGRIVAFVDYRTNVEHESIVTPCIEGLEDLLSFTSGNLVEAGSQ
jgi:hypothetical protein